MKKSKWFRHIFDDEADEIKPENTEDLRSMMADVKILLDALRKYLRNPPSKWQRNFDRNFAKWREEANSDGLTDVCYENDCEGFPEKTRIFAMHAFSLCLRITKINGELKIVNIYLGLAED